MPQHCNALHGFHFTSRRKETRPAILRNQNVDSTKWPTVILRDVKGKPCTVLSHVCEDHFILLWGNGPIIICNFI